MLLRALVAASVDSANRTGAYRGGIVAVQSTSHGRAEALNRASGLFTLVERGLEHGAPVDRTTVIGSITRALKSADDWPAIAELVARPELQIIVSNTSEAGFDALPPRFATLLSARWERLPDGPPLVVIPTELVPDNGRVLQRRVEQLVAPRLRDWLTARVHFASSLVDRITTAEGLRTVTEPYALWAVEGDPALLHGIFPIDDGERVVFAPDISFHRERKLYLLNAAHTALAPLALAAGVQTVREATEHATLAPFFRRLLFEELVPGSGIERGTAVEFANAVWERFRNPWLEHEWRVIAANQAEKFRLRVMPVIERYLERDGQIPEGLARCLTAQDAFLG
jgi:tagaturonate reductase